SRWIREALQKLPGDGIRIEPDRLGVRADERPPEDAGRPTGDVVALKPRKERRADLGIGRNQFQRDLPALSFVPESRPEGFPIGHGMSRALCSLSHCGLTWISWRLPVRQARTEARTRRSMSAMMTNPRADTALVLSMGTLEANGHGPQGR